MEDAKVIGERIDRLRSELADLRRRVIERTPTAADEEKASAAWADLQDLSAAISDAWTGPGVVEEIRPQRDKGG